MLIGTTDTDYTGDLDAVEAEANDVTYLLKEGQRIFPNVRSGDIFYTSAGLRALARSKSRKPGDVSRSHKLSAKAPCTTAEVPLPGAPIVPQQSLQQAANERGLALDTVAHLASLYGSRFSQVLDILVGVTCISLSPMGALYFTQISPDAVDATISPRSVLCGNTDGESSTCMFSGTGNPSSFLILIVTCVLSVLYSRVIASFSYSTTLSYVIVPFCMRKSLNLGPSLIPDILVTLGVL